MRAVFRSKVDRKFRWLALATPGVALVAVLTGPPGGNRVMWIPAGMAVLAAVMVCWILLSTCYELTDRELVTYCGPFTWRIPLAEVSAVRQSSSARSGPALSMDRLEVIHEGGKVLIISPADKPAFMAALRHRAPHVRA